MEILIIILLVIILVIEMICLLKPNKENKQVPIINDEIDNLFKDMKNDNNDLKMDVIKEISENQLKIQNMFHENVSRLQDLTTENFADLKTDVIKEISEGQRKNSDTMNAHMLKLQNQLTNDISNNAERQIKTQELIRESLISIQESTEKRLIENSVVVNKTIADGLNNMQVATDKKLSEIQGGVNKKLDESLNKRLDESFKQVGEQLASVYKSLGELKNLENGVTSLNKTLSNVKTRGVYGEMALENILANILDKGQYDINVATRPRSSERVEFAVKIPDKDNKGFIYLPIDSKFPADVYGRVLEASEKADAPALKIAVNDLKTRIKKEALTIRDKYVAPPNTTDFAIMFLPTESLYAEVLKIDGLVEECQEKYKIVISGPTTLTALLNSLSIGFKYLTVNKKSEEIMKLLGNFKSQFEKFNDLIASTQKKISDAQSVAEKLRDRSNMIQKKLDKVELVEYESSIEIGND